MGFRDFRDRLCDARPLLLDGAMGSELARRGVATPLPLWSAAALRTAPAVVAAIHRDHVAAGAEVVTANSFRTTARTIVRARALAAKSTSATPSSTASEGFDPAAEARELVKIAVELARSAKPKFVAGSIAPLEDCYSPDLVPTDAECVFEHTRNARDLAAAGVDLLLVETMNTIREALAAARAASATGLPTIVSFVCRSDGRLFSGERVSDAARALLDAERRGSSHSASSANLAGLGINCTPTKSLHEPLRELVETIRAVERPHSRDASRDVPLAIAAYGNVGHTDAISGWTNTADVSPTEYSDCAAQWLALGATIVGGCCGTTPSHLAALARHLDRPPSRVP
jgi:homocysteine S-methyltransferase